MPKPRKEHGPWSRNNRPAIGVRTLNKHEVAAVSGLEAEGWEVIKRGWPDFIAVRGEEVRFIEVKPPRTNLKPAQRRVAEILKRICGIEVEVFRPEE